MLESLLAPRARPAWQVQLWNGLAILGLAWFLATSSVAFLREAKAVRVARHALELQPPQDQKAGEILGTFLQEHPEHEEALFLAAVAEARLEELERAAELRSRLQTADPERLPELDPRIGTALEVGIGRRGCDSGTLLSYYDATAVLGKDFHPRVLERLQQTVRKCQAANQTEAAYALMAGLVERGEGASLIEETYLQPLRKAITDGRYDQAESLALGAARLSAEAQVAVDESLEDIRGKVETSLRSLNDVCQSIRTAPGNRVGRFWCFPEITPSVVAGARDAWGRAFAYKPLQLDAAVACYQGFEVVSYGADGLESAEVSGRPDTDLVCRFVQGSDGWQRPNPFWRAQS
jgi:hypothetical protein